MSNSETITESYISSLYAKNVSLFKELNIKFNKRFNLIVGSNGSGKTSILRCIARSLSMQTANLRYGEDAELWTDLVINNKGYRIGFGKGWVKNGDLYRQARVQGWNVPRGDLEVTVKDEMRLIAPNTLQNENLVIEFAPLFVSAYRKIDYKRIEGMKREQNFVEQRLIYRNNASASIDGTYLPDVKQWMINRYFIIEKSWASVEKENWSWLINNLKNMGPKGSELAFIDVQKDLEPTFSVFGSDCYLEELSAGFQAVLSLIFNIIDWIEGINDGENRFVENATGTVIIDELDIHLHPEWQFTIKDALELMFPKMQFIVTTHSPHMIANARKGEIIFLPEYTDGVIDVSPSTKSYSGWTTDQILEEKMGVKSIENKEYTKLINEAFNSIENRNITELESVIGKLERVAHRSDTIVEVLKIRLASLKLEG